MTWCLPPSLVTRFREGLISGAINPDDLAVMSSAERRAFFAKHLGDVNAEPINSAFESKLLLKNRQLGYINWAKKMLGESTPAGKDVISRVERMKEILDPESEHAFLNDLAAKKLGTHVTFDEAKRITELAQKVEQTKAALTAANRLDYGHAVVDLRNYVSELKHQATRLRMADFRNRSGYAVGKVISETAGVAKAMKATLDNSAIFRQGWKTLWTNPMIWQRNARKSFVDLVRQFGGKNVLDEVDADIISRPNFDLMKKAKLDVGTIEEMYPTHLPAKIPGFGRAYKASEAAFTAFVHRTRADVFDKMVDIAKRTGVELDQPTLEGIGSMVNSLTGRGHLGRLEPAASAVNNILFSPRLLKSHIDLLTQPLSGAGGGNFVRKQAALNLLKTVAGTATILAIAKALKPDSVETDPRSADFGKIRVRDTRFDVTGGMASLATLATRLATMKSKSSTTGELRSLYPTDETGKRRFAAQTGKDVVYDFFENKLSPAASVARDLLQGETRDRKPLSVIGETRQLFEPLPVTNYIELKNNPNSAPILAGMIADALGISTNTYSARQKQGRPTRPSRPSRPSRAVRP